MQKKLPHVKDKNEDCGQFKQKESRATGNLGAIGVVSNTEDRTPLHYRYWVEAKRIVHRYNKGLRGVKRIIHCHGKGTRRRQKSREEASEHTVQYMWKWSTCGDRSQARSDRKINSKISTIETRSHKNIPC